MIGGGEGPEPLPRGKLRFGRDGIYASAGAAGYDAAQVDAMSLWQFRALIGGYAKANGGEDNDLSLEDANALGDLIEKPLPWEVN